MSLEEAGAEASPPTARSKTDSSMPKGTNEGEPSAAGKIYEKLVAALILAEEDRRKRVEGRAATILTTSTTMLTLIFGLTIFVSGRDYTFRNHYAVWFLTLALAAFVASAVIAIFIQAYPFHYAILNDYTLNNLVANWNETEDDARQMWVKSQAETITTLRRSNDKKSDLAVWSFGFEVLAIALLALSVGFELHTRL
jgi:hypothetical protein